MELLSSARREGLRLIREQLCCMLCERIFEDPQCLDCKHNFCRECIFMHLRKHESKCPTCSIPIFPSEITRNQFLQSILAAWKAVEHELAFLEANRPELGVSAADTDRALGGAGGGCASPPASRSSHAAAAAAAASTGAAIAAALVHTPLLGTPSRGPVGKSKWNVDTAAIRNEPKQPKQRTGVAQSPPPSAAPLARAESDTPGLTQMTQMSTMSANGATDSAAAVSRRRSIFSPAPSGDDSESLLVMPTQELESYLERIQMESRALSQWEQSRKSDAGSRQPPLSQKQPRGRGQAAGTSAMEKLMKKWVASGSSQSDKTTAAAPNDDGDEDDEDDDDSQTQMPPGGYTDSPDLLASGADALSRLDALRRSGPVVDSRRRRSTLGIAAASLDEVSRSAASKATATGGSGVLTLPLRLSGGGGSAKRPRAGTNEHDDDNDNDDNSDEDDGDDEEVEDSQLRPDADNAFQRRRKHQRVSDDFAGAISAFHAKRPGPPPVARIDTLAAFARPPLAGNSSSNSSSSSSARQLAADIRKSSSFTLIATGLTTTECKRVSTACALLGGRFGLSFDLRPDPATGVLCSSVTHLIAKAVPSAAGDAAGPRCKRTAKYMRALAEGSLVVDYAWVEASLAAGRWLGEERFEMAGDAYSQSIGKPRESHERRRRTGQRHDLFQRFRFVLLCSEQEFDYQVDTLSGVVENFGGSVISSAHFARLGAARRAGKTHVGIVGRATAPADAKTQWRQHQIPIVRVAWLFECISNLALVPYEDFFPYF
ncbi:hypothetical protein PybrP1_008240 [[Pythium] brassicae (nom. inval.)]|nr:hypothetical protein PybrP1_008240 [[Pythium] brassicae (nom. inval.)]